jgi:polyphosphate kinase
MKNIPQIREVSTLSFNERVLQEAEDTRNPLMERLRFLGIFSSNMDEFYKVRVASIHRRIELGKKSMEEVLDVLTDKTRELDERSRTAYAGIIAALADEGIRIVREDEVLSEDGMADWLRAFFRNHVLPSLVPVIVYKGQPFPQLIDGALYLGVMMSGAKKRYAILEVPHDLPRFVELPNGNIMYIDDSIEAWAFKISRDAELDIDNDFSEGYVRKMERVLQQRRRGRPTRFVFDSDMPKQLRNILLNGLSIHDDDPLIPGGRYHNMKDLIKFPSRRPDLNFEKMTPAPHPLLDYGRVPMIDLIREQDILLTYPYQSFDSVIRLLREAAIDPHVDTIKLTVYRAARNSQVINALYNAARNGKKVVVSVELQARFDEENNIAISEKLGEVGVHVVYGVPPMKVHAKLIHIKGKNINIAGLSTGNLNETTGRLYVDSMLFTADKRLTQEVDRVFTYLEQAATMRAVTAPRFRHLLVSPFTSRRTLGRLIDRERKKGEDGYIFLKINHLTDSKLIKKLRDAADAGVKMDFIVRTTYAMRPHDNIRAISILDRYLEHQRIYVFGKNDDEDQVIYMSSADLMERNLDWRVEVSFPIYDPALRKIVRGIMRPQVTDSYKARYLDENQTNGYLGEDATGARAQYETYRYFKELAVREMPKDNPPSAPSAAAPDADVSPTAAATTPQI